MWWLIICLALAVVFDWPWRNPPKIRAKPPDKQPPARARAKPTQSVSGKRIYEKRGGWHNRYYPRPTGRRFP